MEHYASSKKKKNEEASFEVNLVAHQIYLLAN